MNKSFKKISLLSLAMASALGGIASPAGEASRSAMMIRPDQAVLTREPAVKRSYFAQADGFTTGAFSFDLTKINQNEYDTQTVSSSFMTLSFNMSMDEEQGDIKEYSLYVDGSKLVQGHTYMVYCNEGTRLTFGKDAKTYFANYSEKTDEVPYDNGDGDVGTDTYYYYVFTVKAVITAGWHDLLSTFYSTDGQATEKSLKEFASGVNYYGERNDSMKDGETRDLYYSVDAGMSQESIVSSVSAVDLFGVDVPVTVKTSDYEVGKVGVYHIVLSATDSYGQTASATLNVHIVDRTAPVIQLKSSVNVPYSSQFNEADMKSHLTVRDNVNADKDLTYTWKLPAGFAWGSSFGVKGVGNQSFGLTVTDASGNKSSATIQVTVIDNIPPVISRKDGAATTTAVAYGYSKSRTLTLDALLALYKGRDDVDGDNLTVYRKSGEFDSSIGSHSLVIACKDSAGNEFTMTLNYRIQADIPPVFILSDAIIGVTADIKLDENDLKTLIATMNTSSAASTSAKIRNRIKRAVNWGSEGKTDIVINQQDLDAYEAGFDKVGETYQIRYTYTDTKTAETGLEGTVYIRVMDAPKAGDFEDLTGWDGFVQGWKNFWKAFADFFRVTIPEFFNRLKNWFSFRGWKTDKELEKEKKSEHEEKTSSEVILQ